MKNLPDKIYLNFGDITKEEFEEGDYKEFCKIDEYAVTFCENKVFDNDVEYVKKDVFIEKACNFIRKMVDVPHNIECKDGQPLVDDYIRYAEERLKAAEKVVEDFKKYMED